MQMKKKPKIAIFGGSFDPIHKGHIAIIQELLKRDFKKIIIIPTFQNPFKNAPLFSMQTRILCLQKLFGECERIIISDFEEKCGKTTYAIDYVRYFEYIFNGYSITFVLGADNLANLSKWREFETLSAKVDFLVISRANAKIPPFYEKINLSQNITSSEIRENIFEIFKDSRIESLIPNKIQDIIKKEVKSLKIQERLDYIKELLDSKKASNIEIFDLSSTGYITQFVLIATSLAQKHSLSLLDTLRSELKPRGEQFYGIDDENGDWVIVDLGDIMIHLFTQSHREKFNLEEFLRDYKKESGKGLENHI